MEVVGMERAYPDVMFGVMVWCMGVLPIIAVFAVVLWPEKKGK